MLYVIRQATEEELEWSKCLMGIWDCGDRYSHRGCFLTCAQGFLLSQNM